MKRKELIRELKKAGCVLHRHSAKHDIYCNPVTGQKSPVPRHNEIYSAMEKCLNCKDFSQLECIIYCAYLLISIF